MTHPEDPPPLDAPVIFETDLAPRSIDGLPGVYVVKPEPSFVATGEIDLTPMPSLGELFTIVDDRRDTDPTKLEEDHRWARCGCGEEFKLLKEGYTVSSPEKKLGSHEDGTPLMGREVLYRCSIECRDDELRARVTDPAGAWEAGV